MYEKNTIKCSNNQGLITKITNHPLKTKIEWKIPDNQIDYKGTISHKKLLQLENTQ